MGFRDGFLFLGFFGMGGGKRKAFWMDFLEVFVWKNMFNVADLHGFKSTWFVKGKPSPFGQVLATSLAKWTQSELNDKSVTTRKKRLVPANQ